MARINLKRKKQFKVNTFADRLLPSVNCLLVFYNLTSTHFPVEHYSVPVIIAHRTNETANRTQTHSTKFPLPLPSQEGILLKGFQGVSQLVGEKLAVQLLHKPYGGGVSLPRTPYKPMNKKTLFSILLS